MHRRRMGFCVARREIETAAERSATGSEGASRGEVIVCMSGSFCSRELGSAGSRELRVDAGSHFQSILAMDHDTNRVARDFQVQRHSIGEVQSASNILREIAGLLGGQTLPCLFAFRVSNLDDDGEELAIGRGRPADGPVGGRLRRLAPEMKVQHDLSATGCRQPCR